MSRPKRHPLANRILLILVLILILASAAAVLFTPIFGGPYIDLLSLRLTSSEINASHQAVLEEMRDLSELQTVEFIYKLVFPQDFFVRDLSLEELLLRSRSGGSTVQEALSPEEYRHYRAYFLARDAGLQPLSGSFDFLVISAHVELGYDVAQLADDIRITSQDGNGEGLRVELPPAQILNIRIEDPDSSNYPYPDLALDQANWRRIAGFVRDYVEGVPEIREAREEARRSLSAFFSTFLSQAVNIPVEFDSMQ